LDARGFEKGFGDYPRQFPDWIHRPSESHYLALLISALMATGHRYQSEGSTGEGRYDAQIESPAGDHFIIEMRYVGFGRREGEPNASERSSGAGSPEGAAEKSPEESVGKIPEEAAGKSPEEEAEKRRERLKSEAKRKLRMAKAVRSALIQIRTKYAKAFLGGPHRVYQVALVVGGRNDLLTEIEECAR
jgi:hypothetical protein